MKSVAIGWWTVYQRKNCFLPMEVAKEVVSLFGREFRLQRKRGKCKVVAPHIYREVYTREMIV